MDKNFISFWGYITFMIVSTLIMIFIVIYVLWNVEAIKQSPFSYGIKKLGGNIDCTCLQSYGINNIEKPTVMFYINDSGVYNVDSNSVNRKVLPMELNPYK